MRLIRRADAPLVVRSPAARSRAALLLAAALALPAAARAADDPGVQTVRDLYAAFQAAMRDGPGALPARVAAVGPAMDKAFDFPAMARIAVGAKWPTFTPEQQAAVTDAFRRALTVTYANRLARAAGGKFVVDPKVEARGGQRVVASTVTAADGDESEVDFVVNVQDRVQDVLLNGDVSEVAAQRAALAAPLKSGGADGAVKFLRQRADNALKPNP